MPATNNPENQKTKKENMKLIATRDFVRVAALADLQIEGTIVHERLIHKGAVFQIGAEGEKTIDALSSKTDRVLASQLMYAHCIGDANDPAVVKRVNDEIEKDRKREINIEKANRALSDNAMGNFLADLMGRLQERAALQDPK